MKLSTLVGIQAISIIFLSISVTMNILDIKELQNENETIKRSIKVKK